MGLHSAEVGLEPGLELVRRGYVATWCDLGYGRLYK